jgi:N6-L-threonylcarbamoyladenine synthase
MILALESSCDETAVAVFDPALGLAGEWVHSQMALHEAYGGVVPDLASREHLQHFGPLLRRALAVVPPAGITRIAVTHGPGLAACLAMGLAAAKSLALAWRVPVTGVNHLRAHAFSPFLPLHAEAPAEFGARMAGLLPHLGLLVSGGNTALYSIDGSRRIRLLASTLDDAAGEALDKGAKLLGLGYPGGPQVERLAREGDAGAFAARDPGFQFLGTEDEPALPAGKDAAAGDRASEGGPLRELPGRHHRCPGAQDRARADPPGR